MGAYYKVSALVSVCQTDLQTPDSEQISFCNNFDGQKQVQKKQKTSLHFKLKSLRRVHIQAITPSLLSLSLLSLYCKFSPSMLPVDFLTRCFCFCCIFRAFCGWQLTQCSVVQWVEKEEDSTLNPSQLSAPDYDSSWFSISRSRSQSDSDSDCTLLAIGFLVNVTMFKLKCCH